MKAVGAVIRQALTNGTSRAFIILVIILILWSRFQLGGLNGKLIDSYLVLSLPLIVAAIGVTLVIITGQFDLSAAGVMTIVNVLLATKLSEFNPWLAVLLLVLLGIAIGVINGLFVVYGQLPAIAVTLATLIILQGLALVLLPQPGGSVPSEIVSLVKEPFVVPRALIIIVLLAIAWLIFKRTRLGIYMFALGEDEDAFRLSGVAVKPVRITIFGLAGGAYAVAGIMLSVVTESADATIGDTYLLATFAAIAIGGTAFIGGSGSALGTLLGALILVAIPKVLFVLQVSNWMVSVAQGIIIIAAVLVGAIAARKQLTDQFLALRPNAKIVTDDSAAIEGKA